jgi:hypothetical protein
MTSPQPISPAQAVQQLPPTEDYPDQRSGSEAAALAALATYVAGTAGAATAASLVAMLGRIGISAVVSRSVLALSLRIGRTVTTTPAGPSKRAQRDVASREPLYRAAYLLNAAQRVQRAYARPGTRGPNAEPLTPQEALQRALQAEAQYIAGHVAAAKKRLEAARDVDAAADRWGDLLGWVATLDAAKQTEAAAERFGDLLGWVATLDDRTTPDCARAHGANFRITSPPRIGWPGSVHRACRCRPGRPIPGARVLAGISTPSTTGGGR